MQKLEPLRKCRKCGLEAFSEAELNKFVKQPFSLYGRGNLCHSCFNSSYAKGEKNWFAKKRYRDKYLAEVNPKRVWFKDKLLYLEKNPRTNVCSKCGRKYPEELKHQTCMHHNIYDVQNPLNETIEVCHSCHAKIHGLGIKIGRIKKGGI